MQQNGTVHILGGVDRVDEHVVVVAVERADVAEAELFEDHGRLLRRAHEVHRADLRAFDRLLRSAAQRDALEHLSSGAAYEVRKRLAAKHGKVRGDRADVRGDRHLVVVEDHDELALQSPGVVERLVGEAAGQRAVAEHGEDLLIAAGEVARQRHPERGRHRRAGVTGAERIVRRLAAHRKARQAAALANGAESLAPSGEHLVHVRLMADVPHEPVGRKVEHACGARG